MPYISKLNAFKVSVIYSLIIKKYQLSTVDQTSDTSRFCVSHFKCFETETLNGINYATVYTLESANPKLGQR